MFRHFWRTYLRHGHRIFLRRLLLIHFLVVAILALRFHDFNFPKHLALLLSVHKLQLSVGVLQNRPSAEVFIVDSSAKSTKLLALALGDVLFGLSYFLLDVLDIAVFSFIVYLVKVSDVLVLQ